MFKWFFALQMFGNFLFLLRVPHVFPAEESNVAMLAAWIAFCVLAVVVGASHETEAKVGRRLDELLERIALLEERLESPQDPSPR